MYDNYDENDEEFESELEDGLLEEEDELLEQEDELIDREDELKDKAEELRDHGEEVRDNLEEVKELRREIEEVRRMKEDLKREIDDAKHERIKLERRRATRRAPRTPRTPRTPKSPRPPRPPRVVDLSGITEGLEDMMEGLGEQIEMSLKGMGDDMETAFQIPHIRLRKGRRKRSKRERKSKIRQIPAERIAQVVSPLGSEERLRILEFLKDGGKTFNELEEHTGKTGSSLTHHLAPLLEAKYVVKGEVRGTYYVTVIGSLAYRLAQWLTSRVERERRDNGRTKAADNEESMAVAVTFDDEDKKRDDKDQVTDSEDKE
ncbi:MAG: ArsR family transcriptional regulator [Candidatus Thorarchaeota archaeon]|jgi:DNA-binding transcriptional ArsR family regulator